MSYSEAEYLTQIFIHLIFLWLCQQSLVSHHFLFHVLLGSKMNYISVSMNEIVWALEVSYYKVCFPGCESLGDLSLNPTLFPCVFLGCELQNCAQVRGELWGLCRLQRQHRFSEALLLFGWADLAACCRSRNRKCPWTKNHFPEGLSRAPLPMEESPLAATFWDESLNSCLIH